MILFFLIVLGFCDDLGFVDDVLDLGGVEAEVVEHPVEEVEAVLRVRRADAHPEAEREVVLGLVVHEHLLRQRRLAVAPVSHHEVIRDIVRNV
jgi:hypothetical protein